MNSSFFSSTRCHSRRQQLGFPSEAVHPTSNDFRDTLMEHREQFRRKKLASVFPVT